ncbi:DUF1902 domain-containing protein [Salinarimonas ramus]|uniref:DUF1902 domain-containing protein n=1 Tax=Salinarimonas ramus TaxID=690164 RepID=A0A917V3R2_9HYPH|nr:DUF1902 domain-containing protein [Salinarimonas ramus]GGK35487.1 hypothetical protein GCM10011322_22940 [Salinarimonas ramus]
MSNRRFTVRTVYDPDAGVFYTKSDIVGLHVEARTLDEVEALVLELAPDLIVANHMTKPDLIGRPLADLIPMIVLERPRAA